MPSTYIHFWIAADAVAATPLAGASHAETDAYLCGTAAPDVHLLGGPPRPATHFWEIGEEVPGRLGSSRLLAAHPQLAAAALSAVDRAFVAGYLCHLAVDEVWIRTIYLPFFGPGTPVAGAQGIDLQRAYYSVLERRLSTPSPVEDASDPRSAWLGALQRAAALPLWEALPPFTSAPVLRAWFDALLALASIPAGPGRLILWERLRLHPTTPAAEVARAHASSLTGSPNPLAALEARAAAIVPESAVARFRDRAIPEAASLVRDYLAGDV